MKRSIAWVAGACLMVGLGLPAATWSFAGVDHGAHTAPGTAGEQGAAPSHPNSGALPAVPREVWSSLIEMRDAIERDLLAGSLGEIQDRAQELARLSESWQAHAAHLAPEDPARLEDALRQVTTVANALHEAAKGENVARCKRELGRLDSLFAGLRPQVPIASSHGAGGSERAGSPGQSGAAMPSAGDHGMHEMSGRGGGSAHAHTGMAAARVEEAPRATLRIEATEFRFSPTTIRLEAGVPTRIELTNRGAIDHAFVVRSFGDGGELIHLHAFPGTTDSGTFRIDQPGRYALACTIPGHTEAGMEGVLEVAGP